MGSLVTKPFLKIWRVFSTPIVFYCCNAEDNTEDKQQKVIILDLGAKNSFVKMITLYQKHFRVNKIKTK